MATQTREKRPTPEFFQGTESFVAPGPESPEGRRFVTKIMKLIPQDHCQFIYDGEQIARQIVWQGLQKTNQSLAKIHHFRGIEADGEPALLIIQEHIEAAPGVQKAISKIDPNTFRTFQDIVFRSPETTNIIMTDKGAKVIDATMNYEKMQKQRCIPGKCNCNWHDFVERTRDGFGSLPKGYVLPAQIRKRFSSKENPWIEKLEKDALSARIAPCSQADKTGQQPGQINATLPKKPGFFARMLGRIRKK
jgi:hypothetical protein